MELQLVSASVVAGEPADCAVVYHLEEATNLPAISQAHPWAGKNICALRDRLMIQWLFSFPESKKLLEKMTSEIKAIIKKHLKTQNKSSSGTQSSVIRVGVVCQDGAQLGPCFVEELYTHFSYGPVVAEGLKVARYHWDALKGVWGRNKDIVWQVSCIPVQRKTGSYLDQLSENGMWVSFSTSANVEAEERFHQDPYSNEVNLTNMVLDFESGLVYDKRRERKYYIRCMHIIQSKVNCWFLSGDGYMAVSRPYRAAGIQPYSVHPITGEAVFLLGRITYGWQNWCDFGGLKASRIKRERPRYTAARECCEETLGILGSTEELAKALKDFKTNNCFKVVNVDTNYVGHFLRVPYRDYPELFQSALLREESYSIEVDKMRWFSLSSLKTAVQMANSEQRSVKIEALNKDGSLDRSRFYHLRQEFVATFCIADKLNVLDSIAAIARSIHRGQRTDFTMPYVSIPKPRQPQPKSAMAEHSELGGTVRHSTSVPELSTVVEALSCANPHQREGEVQGAGHVIPPGGPMSLEALQVVWNYDLILPRCHNYGKIEQCETMYGDGDGGDGDGGGGGGDSGDGDGDRGDGGDSYCGETHSRIPRTNHSASDSAGVADKEGATGQSVGQLPSSCGGEELESQGEDRPIPKPAGSPPTSGSESDETSHPSQVKSKFLGKVGSNLRHRRQRKKSRGKEGKDRERRRRHRDTDTHQEHHHQSKSIGRSRKLMLYGMGAGSANMPFSF